MSKIISFCLWGNDKRYNVGAIKNAKLAQEIYPGWELVFYVPEDYSDEYNTVMELWTQYNACIVPMKMHAHHLMLARFIPAAMSDGVALFRDCDSRLSQREKLAVDQWMASDKQFLVLKDHPWHAGVPILGGLWGVKAGLLPNMGQMINDFIREDPRNEWQCDQRFLTQKIWPIVKNTAMVFDPFTFDGLQYGVCRDGNEFCGATHDENDNMVPEQVAMLQRYWRP